MLVAGGVGLGQFGDSGQEETATAAAASAPAPGALQPVTTVVGKGKTDGKRWEVSVTVYGPARTKEEAHRQYDLAMSRGDAYPILDGKWEGKYPKTLRIGVTWFSTRVTEGGKQRTTMADWVSPKPAKGRRCWAARISTPAPRPARWAWRGCRRRWSAWRSTGRTVRPTSRRWSR
ncbi:hypothetical protein SAZ11_40885 [Streptomyces sp. FXJ1.4098]|nr:hypothetical protein [Streptomyces sp. FXJ1.4098]